MGKKHDHAFIASPTDGDLFLAPVAPLIERLDGIPTGREAVFAGGLRYWPALQEAVAGATRVGPVHMMARWNG